MIILDTNVLSELMRPQPNPGVIAWVASRPRASLYTTSISQAEILYGIGTLPKGRRRDNLVATAEAMFSEDLAGRVLPFNSAAAAHYAAIVVGRRESGNPIEAFDALIAATALAAGAAGVATHDLSGFEACGLAKLVNPWNAPLS
ncbi:MAG TPA: PIN domain-containing protein [Candidatus Binataceae bacterium]|nr:PIN domain-containing protein [Candidatus Binataceae bacterium]